MYLHIFSGAYLYYIHIGVGYVSSRLQS